MEGLRLKLQYFGTLMERANSLEKTSKLGKIEGKRRRKGQRRNSGKAVLGLMLQKENENK